MLRARRRLKPGGLFVGTTTDTNVLIKKLQAAPGLKFGLYNAIDTFKHYKDAWAKIVVRCMRMNFSWEKSALKYVDVFKDAKAAQPHINPLPFEN